MTGAPAAAEIAVVVLYVQYGSDRSRVDELMRTLSPLRDCRVDYVIVDNSRSRGPVRRDGAAITVINGDNSYREFSGLVCAQRHLGLTRKPYDLVIVTNDTFAYNVGEYGMGITDRFMRFVCDYQLSSGVVYVKNYWGAALRYLFFSPVSFTLRGRTFNHWVRSNFLIVPYGKFMALNIDPLKKEDFFPVALSRQVFLPRAPISHNLRTLITGYLCPTRPYDRRYVWHSHFTLSPETYPLFVAKAMAIINEMRLAQLLSGAGSPVADIRLAPVLSGTLLARRADRFARLLKRSASLQPYLLYPYKRIIKIISALSPVWRTLGLTARTISLCVMSALIGAAAGCTSMPTDRSLSHRSLLNLAERIRLYVVLPSSSGALSDTSIDGRPCKRLVPDLGSVFRGREPLDNSPYDSASYRAANKIGIVWTWRTSDRKGATVDDAVYMSLWDHGAGSAEPNARAVDMEIVKVDAGETVEHVLLIDGGMAARITWENQGRNNPYWYRWWVRDPGR